MIINENRSVSALQMAPSDLDSGGGNDRGREDGSQIHRKPPQRIRNGTNHDGESIGSQAVGEPVNDRTKTGGPKSNRTGPMSPGWPGKP